MNWLLLSCVLATLLGGPAPAGEVQTVYVLRHAEKQGGGRDPGLSERGAERARELEALLADAGVRAVFSTDYRRTRDTVGPLARAAGLEVQIYDPRDLAGLVARLSGVAGPSVVVGHSNTTGEVVGLLGGDPGPPIDDADEFDRLYVVQTDFAGRATTALLRTAPR